ncbi:hypothetical protein NDA11_007316 [Ustilago hordei]|nr:hypothetical protein NDA11_007316 [Ustilago hordei]
MTASSSCTSPQLPPYLPSTTNKPAQLPRAYLNGTQDMLSLFGLMPIYDRAVRPYNPDTVKGDKAGSTCANVAEATATTSSNSKATGEAQGATPTVATGSGSGSATAQGATPGLHTANATPRSGKPATRGTANQTSLAFHASHASHASHAASSTGRISTPALQLNGGAPTFSLHTHSSAILAASPGQLAASAASAAPARKASKPPATYAHYVEDLAGRVRPASKRARAAKAEKGTWLISILFKPEYTPQRIVPFDRETMQAAFSLEPGPVPEIDQAQLEPDEEEAVRPKKKKKKIKQEGGGGGGDGGDGGDGGGGGAVQASWGPSSAARTPVRR